jgi:hypothetical protein
MSSAYFWCRMRVNYHVSGGVKGGGNAWDRRDVHCIPVSPAGIGWHVPTLYETLFVAGHLSCAAPCRVRNRSNLFVCLAYRLFYISHFPFSVLESESFLELHDSSFHLLTKRARVIYPTTTNNLSCLCFPNLSYQFSSKENLMLWTVMLRRMDSLNTYQHA